MGELVCGVDSSTQSTKVEIRKASSGELVAAARAPHPPTEPPRSEQPPSAWWSALASCIEQVEAAAADVTAIAVAGQQHGLVVLDHAGSVLRPAKLWNDTESAPDADRLVAALGADTWARTCGSVPVASFTITKLAWLARNEPETFAQVARIMLPHDWLTFRLTGRHVTDRGDASGSGWWSPITGALVREALDLIDPDRPWEEQVPEVAGPDEVVGTVTHEAAAATGLREGCIVGPGTGDNMAAALGLGLRSGDVVVSLGTSGTVYAVSGAPTSDASGAVAGFADAAGAFLPLVCTLNATKVTDAVGELLGVDRAGLETLALSSPPGANGLTMVPYLDGERTPNLPDARGALVGLTGRVARADVARAAHEGVVCGLLDGMDALTAAGVELGGRFFVVGGGAQSAAYRQVISELTGRRLRIPDTDEVVATGACVQAAAVLTGESTDTIASRWDLGRGVDLEPDHATNGDDVRRRYAQARPAATLTAAG